MYKRIINIPENSDESHFLWGPRQTGKSTLLHERFSKKTYYDLLLADEFERLNRNPTLMRKEILARSNVRDMVIIDEIQLIPLLLGEVQWLITNHNVPFTLCGSSPRKLKRTAANLLGGRAMKLELFPLVYPEIDDFDLLRALNHGLLPKHYIKNDPQNLIQAYVGTYLREEISAESVVRNLPAFGRFLEVAAFSNGSVPVYKNIAQECGVSPPTVKEYFQILEDTMIGRFLPSFQKRPKRRVFQSPKFYYFDLGIANHLLKRKIVEPGNEIFGHVFEHFIFQELVAYIHYSGQDTSLSYWHTTSQLEVDFILGDHEVAIEVKGTPEVKVNHCRGLNAFSEEYKTKNKIIVSLDKRPRKEGDIFILPWQDFLKRLWSGAII